MSDNVRVLLGNVERGILTAEEALAKDYLTPAERAELRRELERE